MEACDGPRRASAPAAPRCQRVVWSGGSSAFGAHLNSLSTRDIRFGTMIAGNSGRIAGACGNTVRMRFQHIHRGHTTQEENIVSNWVMTMEGLGYCRKQLFRQLLDDRGRPRWGLVRPVDATDRRTYQGKDYRVAEPSDYEEAWEVRDAVLSGDSSGRGERYATDLIFVAGPNVGTTGTSSGSTRRTFNAKIQTYGAFREGVKRALRAGLRKTDELQCQVALVAGVSTGIYAGHHFRDRIRAEFVDVVDEVLAEERAEYLRLVYYVTLPRGRDDCSEDPATRRRLQRDVVSLDI